MMQRLWLLLIFLMIAVNPQPATSADRPPFILNDSGFQASSRHRIYWLDNDRVIFTGYEIDLEKIDKEGRYGREQNIYIWDTRENRRTVYVKNASLGCYFRGYIRYSILNGPSKKGPMGQERTYLDMFYSKDTWEGEPLEWEEGVKMHPITCRSYRSRGAGYVDLLPEHGYLDYRRPREYSLEDKVPITWYRADDIGGAKLPLMVHAYLNSSSVRYEQFMNGYVLGTTNFIESTEKSSSPRNDAFSIWLFLTDGNVSELAMPRRDWMRGGTRNFYPTLTGVFTWTHDWGRHKRPPGDAGAYWIHGHRVEKVISEEVGPDSIRVSPDGCKVAFVSEPYEKRQPYVRNSSLHILHVCGGE
ncbi:MAG: hypothetical protein H8K07_07140 [Nitrospira sp.]|nr:hypothetical protein [Nitrospira sp.]